jgi:glutathione synthase
MPLKVAVQMDPIETIRIAGDSSFALMLEAQARGHSLYYYTPDSLSLENGKLFAVVRSVQLKDVEGDHFKLGDAKRTDLSSFDVVLLRQDPPFDMAYITTTHLLEKLQPKVLVVNDPKAVREAPEKIFVLNFAQFMPETLITRSREEIEAFRRAHNEIVMKPLYGHGGGSVFHVGKDDANFGSLFDLFTSMSREPWMVQRFLPEVKSGDKRIVMVDGEFAAALNRVPVKDDIRANLARGGSGELSELTKREREICAAVGPELKQRGLLFAGLDVIGGYLTEINVTSPTGLRAIVRLGGPNVAAMIWDAIEKKVFFKP